MKPTPREYLELLNARRTRTVRGRPARVIAEDDGRERGNGARPKEDDGPVIVCLADVQPEAVDWFWPGRVAAGKLTLLLGDPGVGKSFLTLDVAARVSTGAAWPDDGVAPFGAVLVLSAEDGIADTIRPRVDALRGDTAKVHVLRAVREGDGDRPFCLASDLSQLERAIAETRARLVIVDPLSAYMGSVDSWKDAEVRSVLAPLAALAERTGVAVIGVMHLTKDPHRRAIHRGLGSVGFTAAARIVLAVARDVDREPRRLLAPVKCNLAAPPPTLAYELRDGRLEWEPAPVAGVDVDALLAAGPSDDGGERHDADEFLRETLRDGPMRVATIRQAAEANGLAWRTVTRAKRRLRVKAHRVGFREGAHWEWELPKPRTLQWHPSRK